MGRLDSRRGTGRKAAQRAGQSFRCPFRISRKATLKRETTLCFARETRRQNTKRWRYAFALEAANGSGFSVRARARGRLSRGLLQREEPDHITRALTGREHPHAGLRAAELLSVPEQPLVRADSVVVKSVYAGLSLDWVTALCAPLVVVVLRDPSTSFRAGSS